MAPRHVAVWAAGACLAAIAGPLAAPRQSLTAPAVTLLEQLAPEVNARLIAIERAQGVLLGALTSGNSTLDAADVHRRMMLRLADLSTITPTDSEAENGFRALGGRAGELIRRAHEFHREVLAVIASVQPSQRRASLDAAVQRYQRDGAALADAPKDMAILYDHPYTAFIPPKPPETEPRRALKYASLTGVIWASHWYELAVVEPLERSDGQAARDRGLATIADRFARKLSAGTPLDGYPTELPLAPAIAPGLVWMSERAAAIIDNLNMMLDVICDVLVHPAVADRRAAVNQVIAQFTNRQYRCVQTDEWILVALRHSIFDQGGFALAPMTGYERNGPFGHGQHYGVKRAPPACDP